MNFCIILLGFISLWTAGESGLLGAKECTYGPTYWCDSIRNAKQCEAVTHCIQTVWEKQVLPEDNDDVCSICKGMVKEARDQLLSNKTQSEIERMVEGSCELIPLAAIRTECVQLSDEFVPELIQMLASQMDPLAVCSAAQLCNSARLDRLLAEQHGAKEPRPGDCKDCKTFLTDVISIVKQNSRAELLNHLMAICGRISSLSDGCMALVEANLQSIYDFLTTGFKPEDVCELFGMCEGLFGDHNVALPKTGDEPCDFCVAVVNSWRNNLVSNTTKDDFKMILRGICHQTGAFETECLALVDQYFMFVYEILVSEVEPKQICDAVGLCGHNSVFAKNVPVWSVMEMRPQNFLPLLPARPSFDNEIPSFDNEIAGADEANSYRHNLILPRVALTKSKPAPRHSNAFTGRDEANSYKPLPRVTLTQSSSVLVASYGERGVVSRGAEAQSNECIMCEFVLHFLQNVLNDKKTRDEVEEAVKNVCSLMPHTLDEECQDYIDAYGDQVIQLIILEIDPSTICPMLKLCPGSRMTTNLKSDTSCVMCEYAMTELDEILKDKSNEEAIRKAVDQVCTLLPKSVFPECKTFVDNYIKEVIDLIINGYTPNQICVQLGICDSKRKIETKPVSTKQSTDCVICEFVISKFDNLIVDNSTIAEIEKAVDHVCFLLPTTLMNDCLSFVEDYGDSIIQLLVSNIDPRYTCTKMHLCNPNTFGLGLPRAEVQLPALTCLVCEETVEWVAKNVDADDVTDRVQLILDGVCAFLPGNSKHMCTTLVLNYGELLTQLLEELVDAKHVCQAIKMCPYHGAKALLGAEKCTWGPSYWCQSHLHADACKATQHCVDKVWGEDQISAK